MKSNINYREPLKNSLHVASFASQLAEHSTIENGVYIARVNPPQIPTNDSRDSHSTSANMGAPKILPKICENCIFFENEYHRKNAALNHAGICTRWSEITPRVETCSRYGERTPNVPTKAEILIQSLSTQQQINFDN